MRPIIIGKLCMILAAICAAVGLLLSAACAPLQLLSSPRTETPALAPELPAAPTVAAAGISPTSTAPPQAQPFALELTPLATETLLPTLVLPTEALLAPALQVWDGLPTYPAESLPDFYFRLSFDPSLWALTTDQYGFPALAERDIANCVISPAGGRGLPQNGTVDHDVRRIGGVRFQISTAYVNGVRQFVNYAGGNGTIYTAFEVSFGDQADACLVTAETVLGTLRAVPVSEATPIPTP